MNPQHARYATAVSRAERVLGGRARIAAFFRVPPDKIRAWIDGAEAPPLEVFLRSLDVIADGPYACVRRAIRVAVIK
jgi:hypothetical protein